MPRRGGKRKKTRTHASGAPEGANAHPEEEADLVPRSIVARSGPLIAPLKVLVRDIRKMMHPYTAAKLKERSFNRMKDYVDVATSLGVSHILTVSQSDNDNVVLRIARSPGGPTLHLKVLQYTLSGHIKASQKRPYDSSRAFATPPIVVLNNFGQSEANEVKLMRVMFQNMLPSINIKTVKLSECRRVVLFHYRKEDGLVEMRHYAIRATPVGINRGIKKLLQGKIPNLSKLEDVSEYMDGQGLGAASDSEAEDETSHVVLADKFVGRGNVRSQQSAMKLIELGPRLTMEVFKVEQGVGEGEVIFHKFIKKTAQESSALKARVEGARKLKEERRAQQEANVKRKRETEEAKRQEKAERKRLKYEARGEDQQDGEDGDSESSSEEDDDDEGYGDDRGGDDYEGDGSGDEDEEDEEEEEDDEDDDEE